MDIVEEKKRCRREIRARKAAMADERKADASRVITGRLEALPEYAGARTVLLYSALPDEVGTDALLSGSLGRKRVALPVVTGDTLELRLYDPDLMVPGYKGIPEPSGEAQVISPGDIDLAVIPGMGFDRAGHRLGRGGGFYDRLIPALRCPLVGICFECQILDSVPMDSFDSTVDTVITEA